MVRTRATQTDEELEEDGSFTSVEEKSLKVDRVRTAWQSAFIDHSPNESMLKACYLFRCFDASFLYH